MRTCEQCICVPVTLFESGSMHHMCLTSDIGHLGGEWICGGRYEPRSNRACRARYFVNQPMAFILDNNYISP